MFYLDESGFAPSLPTGYSWCLPGERKRVKYEYPQGRRVNALATYEPFAPTPRLDAVPFERTLTSDDLLAYLRDRLPAADVPRVVVLDNAGIHKAKAVQAFVATHERLSLVFLPPYAPELNPIEKVWAYVKKHVLGNFCAHDLAELKGRLRAAWQRVRYVDLPTRLLRAYLPSST